jgi:hypothetical protein
MERYRVTGEIVATAGRGKVRGWGLDAGFNLCFEEIGDWQINQFIRGEALLGLPFPRSEHGFCEEDLLPPSVYSWKVESIDLGGTPVDRTDRDRDRKVGDFYLIECLRLDVPPRYVKPEENMITFVEE